MIEELFVFLALGGAVIASITDIRSGIIPNKLTFTLIAVGIFGYLAYGILTDDLAPFLASLKSISTIFVVGYIFWMLGAWSAGDAKEFMFIAALIPAYPAFLYSTFNPTIAGYPFVLTVFINTFLSIFPFIFLYSLYVAMEKGLFFRFVEPLKNLKGYIETSFVLVGAISISKFAGMWIEFDSLWILALPALLLLYKIPRKYRISLSAAGILVYVYPLSELWYSRASFIFTYFVIMLLFIVTIRLLLNSINVIRKEALIEETKITDLEDGTIIAEEIYIRDGEVLRDNRSMIEKIKDAAKTGSYQAMFQKKGVGTGAAGVTEKDIELLKEYVKNGKLEDRTNIKKSVPFAPVILAGLVISLMVGDAMLALEMWLYG